MSMVLWFFLLQAEFDRAIGCDCGRASSPSKQIAETSSIFIGRVQDVQERGDRPGYGGTKVKFEVIKSFKGMTMETIVIEAGSSRMCGRVFKVGEIAMVFSSGNPPRTSSCVPGWTVSSSEEYKDLQSVEVALKARYKYQQ